MLRDKKHSEQFEKYLSGEMTSHEAHAFERESLDDPFTQEALEGFEEQEVESLTDLDILRERILKKRKHNLRWIRYVSAAVLILTGALTAYLFVAQFNEKQQLVAQKTSKEQATPQSKPNTFLLEEKDISKTVERIEPDYIHEKDNKLASTSKAVEETFFADDSDDKTTEIIEESIAIVDSEDIIEIEPVNESKPGELSLAQIGVEATITSSNEEMPILLRERVPEGSNEDNVATRASETRTKKSTTSTVSRSTSGLESEITGKVTDESREPIQGVNVIMKETTVETQTDFEGNHELTNVQRATPIFSFIGYDSSEIETGSKSRIDVSLNDATALKETIITSNGATDEAAKNTNSAAHPVAGLKSYRNYLKENIQYPASAIKNKIEGTVVLQLTIASDGLIDQVEIKKSLGYDCDTEAIRLVKEGPDWNPAKKDGMNVEDKVKVKVRF